MGGFLLCGRITAGSDYFFGQFLLSQIAVVLMSHSWWLFLGGFLLCRQITAGADSFWDSLGGFSLDAQLLSTLSALRCVLC